MKHIDIEWEGPFSVGYERETDDHVDPELPKELGESWGVYQIYGNHPIYGRDSLLYIGETRKSDTGRSLARRFSEHMKGRFWAYVGLSVYAGVVKHRDRLVDDKVLIKDVESLLIAAHSPALNRQHIDGAKETASNLHVCNWGYRGDMLPEVSGRLYT